MEPNVKRRPPIWNVIIKPSDAIMTGAVDVELAMRVRSRLSDGLRTWATIMRHLVASEP